MVLQLSVVIPVLNEAHQIPNLLQGLKIFSEDPQVEILFVDGGSTDRGPQLLQEAGCVVIRTSAGRGQQLAVGGENAQADAILFLHADSYFKSSPKQEILNLLSESPIGAFPLDFDSRQPWLKLVQWGSNWRLRHRQIAFGDQGIFMRRLYYQQLGGFRPLPLMEDYDLSIRSKKLGSGLAVAHQPIYTSARRFHKKGPIKTLIKMQYCQYLFRRGADIDKIMKTYYQ